MAVVETSALVKMLTLGAKPALERLKRKEAVVAALKKVHLAPDRPPADFDGVYTYAIVEFCYGKPEPVILLFRNEFVMAAFRKSFESGDERHLRREVDLVLQWNDETGGLGRIDYNLALELTGFQAVFEQLVDRTRSAAQARLERKVGDVHQSVSDLVDRIDRMSTPEEIVRYMVRNSSPAEVLAGELREWFAAVEYKITAEILNGPDEFVWLVRVPARRGYDSVVVLGIGAEMSRPDVLRAASLVGEHRAKEGWVIAPQRVSQAARIADEELDEIFCYTLDELIDERADFEPYLHWLEEEVRTRHIDTRYVPLTCAKDDIDRRSGKVGGTSVYPWTGGGLDDYVGGWLEDDTKEHLSVLGEFGMGKSWFCLHYAWTLAQEWRAAKAAGRKRPRLPLVVPLRDYAKAVTVESLFSEFFFRKHEILPDGYRVFETLNRLGRLLLIFDGFDEMAARVDRQAMINNFWELARAVVPGSKVLLTCRTEHFPEAQQGRDVLGARLVASTSALTGAPPQFEVVELQPFADEQIGELLSRITDTPTRNLVLGNEELMELMRRPVMSELALAALPAIEAGAKVDLARVYLYAVQHKIDADIKAERTFTSLADKVFFLCELSWHMLAESVLTINYREIPDRIRACFKDVVQEQRDLDHWHYDMMGQTMLVRDADGNYTPAHRSLLEFFAAYKIAAELGLMNTDFMTLIGATDAAGAPSFAWSGLVGATFGQRSTASGWLPEPLESIASSLLIDTLTDPVLSLLVTMVSDDAGAVMARLAGDTRNLTAEDETNLGARLVDVIVEIDPAGLRGAHLDDAALSNAVFDRYLRGMDLTGCSLRHADLRNTDLEDVVLVDADLTGAVLDGAHYLGFDRRAAAILTEASGNEVYFCDRRGIRLTRWRIGEPPEPLAELDTMLESASWLDGRIVAVEDVAGRDGVAVHLIDPETGQQQTFHSPKFAVTAAVLGDRPVLLTHDGVGGSIEIVVRDPADFRELGSAVVPGFDFAEFESNGAGRVVGLLSNNPKRDELEKKAVVELAMPAPGTLSWTVAGLVALQEIVQEIIFFGAGDLAAVQFGEDGQLVLSLFGAGFTNGHQFVFPTWPTDWLQPPYPYAGPRHCSVNAAGTVVAVFTGARIHVFDLTDLTSPRFVVDDLPSVTTFAILQKSETLVVANAHGRVAAFDLENGTVIDEFTLSRNVRGANFTGVVGVPPEVLAQLRFNGAVL
ncbi:hypothetical protein GCM10010435_80570 [Winogradskya consettensis]|uniref:NACHT domain-containing protein n=1 Tax=Winogradskya consettensis TaxID=113560 RepID=A0A919SRR5_9ACTN|nr:pentapeptide repeat-containing protein [Actinoplanes consettensis]GIM77251.1 hypothetical protein Aco04nite_54410 [Actinoplanes consettensis]